MEILLVQSRNKIDLKNKIKTYTIQITQYTYFKQAAIEKIRENQKTSEIL